MNYKLIELINVIQLFVRIIIIERNTTKIMIIVILFIIIIFFNTFILTFSINYMIHYHTDFTK